MSSKPVAGKGHSPHSKDTPSPPKGHHAQGKHQEHHEQPKAKAPEAKKPIAKQPEAPAKGSFDARKFAVNGITEE